MDPSRSFEKPIGNDWFFCFSLGFVPDCPQVSEPLWGKPSKLIGEAKDASLLPPVGFPYGEFHVPAYAADTDDLGGIGDGHLRPSIACRGWSPG